MTGFYGCAMIKYEGVWTNRANQLWWPFLVEEGLNNGKLILLNDMINRLRTILFALTNTSCVWLIFAVYSPSGRALRTCSD